MRLGTPESPSAFFSIGDRRVPIPCSFLHMFVANGKKRGGNRCGDSLSRPVIGDSFCLFRRVSGGLKIYLDAKQKKATIARSFRAGDSGLYEEGCLLEDSSVTSFKGIRM